MEDRVVTPDNQENLLVSRWPPSDDLAFGLFGIPNVASMLLEKNMF